MSRIESLPREGKEARSLRVCQNYPNWFFLSKLRSMIRDFVRERTYTIFHFLIKNSSRMRPKMKSSGKRSDSRVSRAVLNGSLFNDGDPFDDWALEYGRLTSTCWIIRRTSESWKEESYMEKEKRQILRSGRIRREVLYFDGLEFLVHFQHLLFSETGVTKKTGQSQERASRILLNTHDDITEMLSETRVIDAIRSMSSILCRQLSRDAQRQQEFNRSTFWYSSETIHIYCKDICTSWTENDRWSDRFYFDILRLCFFPWSWVTYLETSILSFMMLPDEVSLKRRNVRRIVKDTSCA